LTPTEVFNWRLFGFAILTTLGANTVQFANDYGDGIKGTDNEDRVDKARHTKWCDYSTSHETRHYNYISIDIVIGYVVDLLCV
jgi:1,4-dihydroxy-2-naphthoate octaprenyltransferase